MKQNNQQRANANKIKKWIQATQEVEKTRFAIPITRLTSIKSLCVDAVAAEKFALYIAQRVQQMSAGLSSFIPVPKKNATIYILGFISYNQS
ncbi:MULTISPECIES: hypothetical protein [unclassified Microcoleus]|uniref:hypothetical protein n=1 Tax=unclassified Microcoleus TaxID=2642155 RepID=UPI001DA2353D|nr:MULTISPECIES: hypothetical protein [unclassified Microcoleus]MCC3600076.1 hypothetical protein [Microcoleus sp. PH2017_26_ELK_O_A]MCC3625069.1 hypothetical protein [Microcoleus sp. PH2017_36_ELK_O_B]